MHDVAEVVAQIRHECTKDYVGVWEIGRLLREGGHSLPHGTDLIVKVVAELLNDPRVEIGDFEGQTFTPWRGNVDAHVNRLLSDLGLLGHEPDIGDVAWLVER